MLLCGEAEPARGGEVERLGIARQFADHEGEVVASDPFLECEQQVLGTFRGHMNQPMTQRFGQAGAIRPAAQPHCGDILHP